MAQIKLTFYKVTALPSEPEKNSVYFVRTTGVRKIYVVDDLGTAELFADGLVVNALWGAIGGSLSNQTDLQTALATKAESIGETTNYLSKFDTDGNLVNATLEETVSGKIRATGKELELRNNSGEFYTYLLTLTSQGYSKSARFQMGDSLAIDSPRFILWNESHSEILFDLQFLNKKCFLTAAPVYDEAVVAQITTDNTTITLTNPPNRLILSADADSYIIAGLAVGQVDGQCVTLENPTANSFRLSDENTSAASANRFNTPNNMNVILPTFSSIELVYNGTLARWLVRNFIQ